MSKSFMSDRPLTAPSARNRRTAPRFIAVGSGKGGVGKTWFSITLAHALARLGRRVLLFDADFGLANVDIQLGLSPRHDLGHVLAGVAQFEQAAAAYDPGGFDVLAGCSGSGSLSGMGPAMLERVLDLLGVHGAHYDHVLLDLGAGLEGGVRQAAAWADALLVLATDEPTSMTDAYATLKLHAADRPDGDVRLVVNQAASSSAADRTAAVLARVCTSFLGQAPVFLGGIRRDPRVPMAIRHQALLLTRHPSTNAALDIERIATAL
jgi:flagellar biosynthesis protein FlhG